MELRISRIETQVLAVVAICILAGCATTGSYAGKPPLDHFFKVDENIYRGAQPSPEGFRQLRDLGIKTVINLRAQSRSVRQQEKRIVESLGMEWVSLPMRMYFRPTDEQVIKFLQIVLDDDRTPAFVHCQKGQDRTGSLIAVYRIVKHEWVPERAYREARLLGLTKWNPFMRNLILNQTKREYLEISSAP